MQQVIWGVQQVIWGVQQVTPVQQPIPTEPRSRSARSVVDAKLERTSLSANAS